MKEKLKKIGRLAGFYIIQGILHIGLYEAVTVYYNRWSDFIALVVPLALISYLIALLIMYVLEYFVKNKVALITSNLVLTLGYIAFMYSFLAEGYPNRFKLFAALAIVSTVLKTLVFKSKPRII